jgi:hypothetical protein
MLSNYCRQLTNSLVSIDRTNEYSVSIDGSMMERKIGITPQTYSDCNQKLLLQNDNSNNISLNKSDVLDRIIHCLTTWNENLEIDYYNGRIPDCTTMCIAASYGKLDFLKWAVKNGYGKELGFNTLNYAATKFQIFNNSELQKEIILFVLNQKKDDWEPIPKETMDVILAVCKNLDIVII